MRRLALMADRGRGGRVKMLSGAPFERALARESYLPRVSYGAKAPEWLMLEVAG